MRFLRQSIPDVVVVEPSVYGDDRGYFMESFREDLLRNFLGHDLHFVQDNESLSSFGVLRGLHFQLPPMAQSKLVRVIEGSVLDVVVDIRVGSPFYGKSVKVDLNAENKRQVFVPRGFAHGFLVTSPTARFSYKVDNYYCADMERGIAFDDPELNLDWGVKRDSIKLSPRDLSQPPLHGLLPVFSYEEDYYSR